MTFQVNLLSTFFLYSKMAFKRSSKYEFMGSTSTIENTDTENEKGFSGSSSSLCSSSKFSSAYISPNITPPSTPKTSLNVYVNNLSLALECLDLSSIQVTAPPSDPWEVIKNNENMDYSTWCGNSISLNLTSATSSSFFNDFNYLPLSNYEDKSYCKLNVVLILPGVR